MSAVTTLAAELRGIHEFADLKEDALGSAQTEAGAADVQALDVSDAGQVARATTAAGQSAP